MYTIIIVLATFLFTLFITRILVNRLAQKKSHKMSTDDINNLLTMRMKTSNGAKKSFEIDSVLLRQGYSFVTPVTCYKHQDFDKYIFTELASEGNRLTAWKLCKTIKLMNIEGISEVKIPKPGHCVIYTYPHAPYSSLQKVFTLLGVHLCDIVVKEHTSADNLYSYSA
jgi:hypothetical protein